MLTVSFFDGRFDPLALKQDNFSAQALKSAGFSAQLLMDIGFDLKSLLPPVFDVFTLMSAQIEPQEIAKIKVLLNSIFYVPIFLLPHALLANVRHYRRSPKGGVLFFLNVDLF